jgi:hypothetical protein
MAHRTLVVDGFTYEFASDDPPLPVDRTWSVVQGRVIDEITGKPLPSIRVEVAEPELDVEIRDGGLYTLIARPWPRFPPLGAPIYPLNLTVEADDYIPAAATVAVPTGQRAVAAPAPAVGATVLALSGTAGLAAGQLLLIGPAGAKQERLTIANLGPAVNQVTLAAPLAHPHAVGDLVVAATFTPTVVADIAMHRRPVVIRGRTVRQNSTGLGTTPVASALIGLQGLWRTASDVTRHLPPVAANLASLAPGLYAARGVGATLAAQALPVIAGDDKLLIAAAPSGSAAVDVSSRQNLVAPPAPPPSSVLRIDADESSVVEHISITGVSGLGALDEPGRVSLAHAPINSHRRGAHLQRVAPQPAAPAKAFTDAAMAGDTCVYLSDLAGLAAAGTAVVSGGPTTAEFQQISTFAVTSDADGYFQLPPLSRVAQVAINASAPALTPIKFDFQPDYTQSENWVDIVFA